MNEVCVFLSFPFGIIWLFVGDDFSAIMLHSVQSEKTYPINCFESYEIFVTVTLNNLLQGHNVHFIEMLIKQINFYFFSFSYFREGTFLSNS